MRPVEACSQTGRYRRRLMSTRRFGSGTGLTGPACVYSGHQPSGLPKTIQRMISCSRAYSMVSSGDANYTGVPRARRMTGAASSTIMPYRTARSDTLSVLLPSAASVHMTAAVTGPASREPIVFSQRRSARGVCGSFQGISHLLLQLVRAATRLGGLGRLLGLAFVFSSRSLTHGVSSPLTATS